MCIRDSLASIGLLDESTGQVNQTVEFSYLVNNSEANVKIGEAIQADLSKVGINLKVEQQEWNVFLNSRKDGQFDFAREGWLMDYKMCIRDRLQEITREELLSKCSEKITLTVDNPNKAVPVLDKMGFVHYMIVDKNHIDVYERLNDSAALNTALVTAGVSVAQLAVTGMELETYFLSITGGATNV